MAYTNNPVHMYLATSPFSFTFLVLSFSTALNLLSKLLFILQYFKLLHESCLQ